MRVLLVSVVFGAAALGALSACTPAAAPEEAAVEAGAPFPDAYEGPAEILTVADAGYPMYVVTARVEGYEGPIEMLLNDQGADLGGLRPDAMAGQTLTLTVVAEPRNNLAALQRGDQPLMAPTAMAADSGAITITGVLEGAGAVTESDLPDLLTIATAEGQLVTFEAYVTPEMTTAEGQTVTATYVADRVRTITTVRPGA